MSKVRKIYAFVHTEGIFDNEPLSPFSWALIYYLFILSTTSISVPSFSSQVVSNLTFSPKFSLN